MTRQTVVRCFLFALTVVCLQMCLRLDWSLWLTELTVVYKGTCLCIKSLSSSGTTEREAVKFKEPSLDLCDKMWRGMDHGEGRKPFLKLLSVPRRAVASIIVK